MHPLRHCTMAIFSLLLLATAAFSADFEIALSRPLPVGLRFFMFAEGTQFEQRKTTLVETGDVFDNQTEDFAIRLKANLEILQVNAIGQPNKAAIVLSECVLVEKGREQNLAASAQRVVGSMVDGQPVFAIDGQPVDAPLQKVLALAIPLADDPASDNDIFGTTQRQPIGASWLIRKTVLQQNLAQTGIFLKDEDIEGQTTLLGTATVKDIPCLQIESTVKMQNITPPLPPLMKVTHASGQATRRGLFPVDIRHHRLGENTHMNMSFTAIGPFAPGDPEMRLDIQNKREVTRQYWYLNR